MMCGVRKTLQDSVLHTIDADLKHEGQYPAGDSLRQQPQCSQGSPAVVTVHSWQHNEVGQPQQLASPEYCLLLPGQVADADGTNAA